MSEVTNKKTMKSTLKIAYAPQGNLGKPVIKIVQPVEVVNPSEYDRHLDGIDGWDDLIRTFLQFPMNPALNEWFQVDTRFPVPLDERETTHFVTTIAAVDEPDLFKRFKNSILNRVIPFEDLVKINRNEVGGVLSENSLKDGSRPIERLDLSLEKYRTINQFFNWLIDDVEYCSFDEQQPKDADGRPRN